MYKALHSGLDLHLTSDVESETSHLTFLGFFAKLRKTTISFVVLVRPSAWNNSTPTGRILMKSDFVIFRKSVEKIQVSLKY
jgi:hypothetical protein